MSAAPVELEIPRDEEYAERLATLVELRGREHAFRWAEAQPFLALSSGRVKSPPTGWSFVAVVGLPGEVRPPMTEEQRRDYRSFWAWYLPVERNLLRLAELVRFFDRRDPALSGRLAGVGIMLENRYRDWLRDGRIAWLPKRPPYSRTVIEALGAALLECSGPAPEREDLGALRGALDGY